MAVLLDEPLEPLGDGGFAEVWKGKDDLGRPVAVKIIREACVMMSDALAHAKALARAHHSNVVIVYRIDTVLDPNTGKEIDCVVMELIDGKTVAAHVL